MKNVITNKISSYPENVKKALYTICDLIDEIAEEESLGKVEETLKWGEPSFLVKGGSTIRVDWKQKTPKHYYIFFNCRTILVETFRELYGNMLQFEGNRAIVLKLDQPLPRDIIKHCITLALKYKSLKDLILLGQ